MTARRRGFAALCLLAAALWAGPACGGDATVATLRDFKFEDGSVLPELHLAYETQGKLSPERNNAIVVIPGARGDRESLGDWIGPGKTLDTDRYFVVSLDPIGGGGSSSPADGAGQEFPRYTVRDMMQAAAALVSGELKLPVVRAVVGRSMGAFIALEWAIHHPDAMRGLVLMAPSPKAEANFQVVVDTMSSVVALDPEWQGGHYEHNPEEGLRRAGIVYFPWSVSAAYLERISAKQLAAETEKTAKSFAAWDANALMFRYAACRAHDVSASFAGDMPAALGRVTAPTLILASPSDRLIGPYGAQRIRDGVRRATYLEVPSDIGHRALGPDTETGEAGFIGHAVRRFLAGG